MHNTFRSIATKKGQIFIEPIDPVYVDRPLTMLISLLAGNHTDLEKYAYDLQGSKDH